MAHINANMRRALSRFAKEAGRMNNKVAVITGGGSGIGRETALLFAREGARGIVIADWNEHAGKATAADIGERAIFIKTDVANSEQVKQLFDTAEDKFGNVEVIFNNAGIMDVRFYSVFSPSRCANRVRPLHHSTFHVQYGDSHLLHSRQMIMMPLPLKKMFGTRLSILMLKVSGMDASMVFLL